MVPQLVGEGTGIPVPLTVTAWGLFGALSERSSVALKLAADTGLKLTVMMQELPTARDVPQLLVAEKSEGLAPVKRRPEIVKGAVPLLASVVVSVLPTEPTTVFGKASMDGVRDAPATIPVPVRLITWGLPVALSANVIAALKLPVAAGLNVTDIVQTAPAASAPPQLFAVIAKSPAFAPPSAAPLRVRGEPPVFVSVTGIEADVVPTTAFGKATVVVESERLGGAAGVPPPLHPVRAATTIESNESGTVFRKEFTCRSYQIGAR